MVAGQANLLNGSIIAGPNFFTLNGGSLAVAAGDEAFAEKLSIQSGSITGLGTLTITGTGSQWTGGAMTGGGTTRIAAGADLTVGGTQTNKSLGNRTITNEGTLIDTQGAGRFVDLDGIAVLNNVGLFDIRGDESWQNVFTPTGSLTINNTGTLRKSAGAGDFQLLNVALNNSGTVEVLSGRLGFGGDGGVSTGTFSTAVGTAIVFQFGTQTWQSGAQGIGSGAIELGFLGTFIGTLAVQGAAAASRLHITAGVLSGLGTLTITGTGSQWTGGAMTGGGTTRIAAGADLTIGGTQDNKSLGNRTITNEGTLIDSQGGGRFVDLDGIAVLNNVGLCDIRGDESWQNVFTPTGSLTINNTGTLRKSAGAGDFQFLSTTINNAGRIEVQSGTLALVAGQANLLNGSIIAGPNFFTLNGGSLAVAAGDEAFAEKLSIQSGSITGLGTLTITGTGSQWTGGAMTGGGTTRIAAGADLTVGGTQTNKSLGNRTITNEGTLIDTQGAGRFVDLDGIAVLNNVGLFDIRGDESWQNVFTPTGSLTINNTGTLRKSAGAGDFQFLNATLSNVGIIEVLVGLLLVNGVPV